ncbi:hemerythrin domain-containing protein [Cyclobacterium jeungdonense]|uniref:Hemerythrin domain-containing protein n=1 Tax=Cyclobacterium jeungdonense TaxID=708087 RepID=A0ABT8CE81_9BACT|nr:hemerythrin domain-containing protein [Cyclobacterium jeungdonense]MDN3690093.1 hemerythrin domain-containing protein [Cyclobacterium jeungdonense]
MTKPLKRHSSLIPFSQDHHFGLLLSWKICQGIRKDVDTKRIVDYLDYFVQHHLEPHFQLEEKLLFSFLAKNDLLRKEAEEQHASIRSSYEQIFEKRGDKDRLTRFADELKAHIRFEERKLFQYMQVELVEEDLEILKENVEDMHQKVQEEWEDPFWEG